MIGQGRDNLRKLIPSSCRECIRYIFESMDLICYCDHSAACLFANTSLTSFLETVIWSYHILSGTKIILSPRKLLHMSHQFLKRINKPCEFEQQCVNRPEKWTTIRHRDTLQESGCGLNLRIAAIAVSHFSTDGVLSWPLISPMAEKGPRYLNQLDTARCDGKWNEVPELARKVEKHLPSRKCEKMYCPIVQNWRLQV